MQPERASTSHVILCFNSGSSSVKFALYRLGEDLMIARHTRTLLVSTAAP
jgi:acetate kinase